MIIAFAFFATALDDDDDDDAGTRDVIRAKKFMSDFIRGQGRAPVRPIPSFVDGAPWTRIGVVATTRVSGLVVFVVVVVVLGIGIVSCSDEGILLILFSVA